MSTSQKRKQLPHPVDARNALGISQRELRRRGQFSFSTVRECEKLGRYPLGRGTRHLYLSILGLPTDDLDAPVAPLSKKGGR